jgi:HlyD family secretion protein
MKKLLKRIKTFAFSHKKISTGLIICLIGGSYWIYSSLNSSEGQTLYTLAKAEKGEITNVVNGTGQVSALNQVDIKSKNSGDIVYLNAVVGKEVKEGDLIAQIDYGNALYELETAKLSYDELINIDPDDIADADNNVSRAKEDLIDSYTSARSNLISASTEMSDVLNGLDELFDEYLSLSGNSGLTATAREYINRAGDKYDVAENLLDDFIKKYRTISKDTSDEEIEKIISESYEISVSVSNAAKYAQDAVVYLRDRDIGEETVANESYSEIISLVSDANSIVTKLLGNKNNITESKRNLVDAERELVDLNDGPDSLDIREKSLTLKQKQDAYADYFIKASFDGVIASVNYKKGDEINSSSVIATLITKQKIAEISFNEVDAAKVSIGQEATLTFDALEDITISGRVAEIDLVGTVSSGVVNYNVKISFETDNEKIKPGMTVNADIVTEKQENIIRVPISAVSEFGNKQFISIVKNYNFSDIRQKNVAVPLNVLPIRTEIQTGVSNDEYVEIKSGLNEGDVYVVKTAISTGETVTSTTKNNSAPSGLFGGAGGGRMPR